MDNARFKRVTDLFVEGKTLYLGQHPEEGKPVTIWLQKPNSFIAEDARRDAGLRRSERMVALGKEDNPERMGVMAEVAIMDIDTLADRYIDGKASEIALEVYNDLQVDPEQRERLDRVTRLAQLLNDAGAPADDPRRQTLAEDEIIWMQALQDLTEKVNSNHRRDAIDGGREALEKAYFEQWRLRMTTDDFMEEKRTTELFLCMRECQAVDISTGDGDKTEQSWDHRGCDHDLRLMDDRSQVRKLPEVVIMMAIDVLDEIVVNPGEAGNLDAPTSSSDSSELSSAATEASTPSSPVETPSELPTS